MLFMEYLYYGHGIRLSSSEMREYLDAAFVLENNESINQQIAAVKSIKKMSVLQKVSFLPLLMEMFLSESRRNNYKIQRGNDSVGILFKECRDIINSLFAIESYPDGVNPVNKDGNENEKLRQCPLPNMINNLEKVSLEDVPANVSSYLASYELPQIGIKDTYLEADYYAPEIFLLSLLFIAFKENKEWIEGLEADCEKLIVPSINGSFGLFPWQIALELHAYKAENLNNLINYFPHENWKSVPCCIKVIMYYFLSYNKETKYIVDDDFSHSTFYESWNWRIYKELPGGSTHSWITDRGTEEEIQLIEIIIWQLVCWDLSFESSPDFCSRHIADCWYTPNFNTKSDYRRILSKIYFINSVQKRVIANTSIRLYGEDSLPNATTSPWLHYSEDDFPNENGSDFSEFPYFIKPYVALRSFYAAVLLRRIFSLNTIILDHSQIINLCRSLINMGDAYDSQGTLSQLKEQYHSKIWSSTLRGLLRFAYSCVQLLGKGDISNDLPYHIVDIMTKQKNYSNIELIKLQSGRSLLVGAKWAAECLSGITDIKKINSYSWFNSQNASALSGAERVCSLLLEKDYLRAIRSKNVQTLMVELFSDKLKEMAIQYEDHWMELFSPDYIQYQTADDLIKLSDVIFYPSLNFDDWKDIVSRISPNSFEPAAWIVVLTRNLKLIIDSYSKTENNLSIEAIDSYIDQWCNEVSAINPVVIRENPLILYELCQLLKIHVNCVSSTDSIPSILKIAEIVIDLIFDFLSKDNLFYLGTLIDAVSCTNVVYPFNLIDRLNITKCMIIHFYNSLELDIIPESLMRLYIYNVRSFLEDDSVLNIVEAIDDYFSKKITQNQLGHMVTINEEEWEPLTDRFLQKHLEKMTVARLQQDITKDKGDYAISNPFIKKEISGSITRQIGIICEKKPFRLFGDDRNNIKRFEYTVKTVSGYIKVKRVYRGIRLRDVYEPGDLVSLCHKEKDYYEIYPLAWKMEETNKTIYVNGLRYYYSDKQPKLIFEYYLPNGQRLRFPYFFKDKNESDFEMTGEYLTYWVPDAVSSIINQDLFKKEKYEVVFDSTFGAYVPVKRNFLRLLVEQIFIPENNEHVARLIYIKSEKRNGRAFDLFSILPGENYLIDRKRWLDDSLSNILNNNANSCGLIIHCKVIEHADDLFLTIIPGSEIDDKNVLYRDAFNDGDTIIAEYSSEKHGYYKSIQVGSQNFLLRITGNYYKAKNKAMTFVVSPNGWNNYRQRSCQIVCEGKRIFTLKKEICKAELLREIISIKTGDIVHLNKIIYFNAKGGYYTGLLSTGITVLCAADSVSLIQNSADSLFTDRECIVENIHVFQNRDPEKEAVPVELPEFSSLSVIQGIVGTYVQRSEDETVSWGLWILNGEEIKIITIPSSSFCIYPKSLGATVIGERTDDGKWVFKAQNKNIYVRALWKLEDHIQNVNSVANGTLLAQNIFVQGKGICTITQDEVNPIIHLWNTGSRIRNNLICGLEATEGSVIRKDYLHADPSIFKYVKNKDLVFLQQKGKQVWGISKNYEFDIPQYNWNIEISIRVPLTIQGTGLYDVRRLFHVEYSAKSSTKEKSVIADKEIYDAWLRGDRHVFGKIDSLGLRLTELKIPEYVSRDSVIDNYTDYVSFSSEEEMSFVTLNKRYPYGNSIRAVLEIHNDKWYASCTKVTPYKLDEDLVREFHALDHQIIKQHIYFAGNDNDSYLFEWGYGFVFSVNKKDLINENQNQIGNDLFYGDLISEFSFVKSSEGTYGWKIEISEGAIERQLTYQLWNDSFNNDVIQILKISINRNSEEVKIHEISFVNYNVNIQSEMNGWTFRKMQHINLDFESASRLLAEEGDIIEDRIILAALDEKIRIDRSSKPVFKYISLDDADMNPHLLCGKTICMEAQEIRRTGGFSKLYPSNDYCLQFVLPGNKDFNTSVIRRAFSFDESKLRIAISNGNHDKYLGKMMLVTILNKDKRLSHSWNGSVIGRIRRSLQGLREWVKKEKSCLVVIGKEKDGYVPLEIAPGIICQINSSAFINSHRDQLEQGSIAALFLDKSKKDEEKIGAKIVFPSDLNYFSEQGRPVEILPMDGAIRHYLQGYFQLSKSPQEIVNGEKAFEKLNNDKRHFSIAGFPQLTIMNCSEMMKLIKESIPRTRFVRKHGNSYVIDNNKQYIAAHIKIDNKMSQPSLNYIVPFLKSELSEWGQLSFMDDTVQNIRAFTENGKWHYHDKETVVYDSIKERYFKVSLPEGTYKDVVVFPDKWGKLRYKKASAVISNGYSAREICENGLPNREQYYPIACVTASSLWVEMMPGRIVEIPKDYLFLGSNHKALSNLICSSFCCGDTIRLDDSLESFSGGQRVLMLVDFKAGLRAFLGNNNNYIPVKDVLDDSGLILGGVGLQLIYPIANTSQWYGQSLICLDGNNKLKKVDSKLKLNVGDIVFLKNESDNRIGICGTRTNFNMMASSSEKWENATWVYTIIKSPFLANIFLKMFNLPVRIDYVNYNKQTIYYSFSQKDFDTYPPHSIICGVCIGTFKSIDSRWRVIVKSGDSLIRISYECFIEGITNPLNVTDIVKTLAEKGTGLWFYKDSDGTWRSGIMDSKDELSPRVELLFPVYKAKGIICQSLMTKRIYWLPAERTTRAGNVSLQNIWNLLQKRVIRNTTRMINGQISIINTTTSLQQFANLHKGKNRYHLTPYLRLENELSNKTKWIYLSELFPLGDIVVLESEYPINVDLSLDSEPVAVELLSKRPTHIVMVPYGTFRVTQHLPSWFNISLNSIRSLGQYNLNEFRNRINIRYSKYGMYYLQGAFDSRSNDIKADILKIKSAIISKGDFRTELKYKICYLSGIISRQNDPNINKYLYHIGKEYIKLWLKDEGKNLLLSHRNTVERAGFFIDLLPLLAIIDILYSIGNLYKDDTAMQELNYSESIVISSQLLAVHLTRIVGLMCENSIHFEVLIRDWIYQNKSSHYWKCLNYLSIEGINCDGTENNAYSGQLLPAQIESIKAVCNHIYRLDYHTELEPLQLVRDCLLYSIGELNDYSRFLEHFQLSKRNYITVRLARLGHLLTPAAYSRDPAIGVLPDEMAKLIKGLENEMAREKYPLVMMNEYTLPLKDNERGSIEDSVLSLSNN